MHPIALKSDGSRKAIRGDPVAVKLNASSQKYKGGLSA